MSSFGQTLRKAREAKGLSLSQVAKQTRILIQIVTDMENEDFHRIAAPIYGRGFVRLFAECVGLDPQPLIREFMDIYEGRRAPIVRIRDVPATPPPEPEPNEEAMPASVPVPEPVMVPEPEPIPEPMPIPEPESIPEPPPEPVAAPTPEPIQTIQETPPVVRGLELFEQAHSQPTPPTPRVDVPDSPFASDSGFVPPTDYADDNRPSAAERFREGLSEASLSVIKSFNGIPRSAWRTALLALGVLAVLALLVYGGMKLHQTVTSVPPTDPCPGGVCEFDPQAQTPAAQPTTPAENTKPTPAPSAGQPKEAKSSKEDAAAKPGAKAGSKAGPKTPVKLMSTGEKIAPLYID